MFLRLSFFCFSDGQAAPGVAPLCFTPLAALLLVLVARGILPLLGQGAAHTAADQPAPPASHLTPAWERSWPAGRRRDRLQRRLLVPAVALHLVYLHAKRQVPPPPHVQLKLTLHSQKETRRQQQKLSPRRLRSYHRMLPALKIRLLHLHLPLPPPLQHRLLLSPLLLCHPVHPHWFHPRHLRQTQIFSLPHPQPHPRPNRQLRFPHVAPSDRQRFTRRRLCLLCLYRPYCWETLRTGEDLPIWTHIYDTTRWSDTVIHHWSHNLLLFLMHVSHHLFCSHSSQPFPLSPLVSPYTNYFFKQWTRKSLPQNIISH